VDTNACTRYALVALTTDVAALRVEVKADVAVVKADVAALRTEVAAVSIKCDSSQDYRRLFVLAMGVFAFCAHEMYNYNHDRAPKGRVGPGRRDPASSTGTCPATRRRRGSATSA
jgi:hypothetical protein